MTATDTLLRDLDDPAKFVPFPEAEVMDVHQVKDASGNVVRDYTRELLETFAAETNKRDAEGCPCSMTIGHTVDGAPETEQPPIVGYWRKLRVAFSSAKKKFVLLATPFAMKEHEETVKTFPKCSIEAWRTRQIIDPIAIMRRTPDRATQWTHSLPGTVQRFKLQADRGRVQRYAMEDGCDPLDPTAPPSAMAPTPEEVEKFTMCAKHVFPHLKPYHDKHMAVGMAMPGGPGVPHPGASDQLGKNMSTDTQTAEKHALLEAELKTLKDSQTAKDQAFADLSRKLRDAERKPAVERFAAVLDEGEDKDLLDEEPDKFALHVTRLEKRAEKIKAADPTHTDLLPTAGPPPRLDKDAPKRFGAAEEEKHAKYLRDKSKSEKFRKLPFDKQHELATKFAMSGEDAWKD
jgi:hypothetical protein